MKHVLLYYKYAYISDPQKFRDDQYKFFLSHNIKGRVIVAHEGINGTVSGEKQDIDAYKAYMWENPLFADIEFKENTSDEHVFKKLSVKVRSEIVSLHLDKDIDLTKEAKGGKYLEPEELHNIITKDGEEYYIVDMRNDYESAIGKFKDSIAMQMRNFRDLPKALKDIEHLKKKKVITVCTGGIRCEKASAYLVQEGFEDVYQLHGGIVKYGKMFPDEGFEGKCYVFDSRIAIPINTENNKKIIAVCHHCHKPCDDYVNCCNAECNMQFVCCESCNKEHESACSDTCKEKSRYKITANAGKNT